MLLYAKTTLYLPSCPREQSVYFSFTTPAPDSLGDRRALWNNGRHLMSQAALRVVGKEQNADRKRALEAALSQIDRAFGKGSVMKMGARDLGVATDAVSTGSLGLDTSPLARPIPRGERDAVLRHIPFANVQRVHVLFLFPRFNLGRLRAA